MIGRSGGRRSIDVAVGVAAVVLGVLLVTLAIALTLVDAAAAEVAPRTADPTSRPTSDSTSPADASDAAASDPSADEEAAATQDPGASVGPPLPDLEETPDPVPSADPEAAADPPTPATAAPDDPETPSSRPPDPLPTNPLGSGASGTTDVASDAVDRERAQEIADQIRDEAADRAAPPDLLSNLLGEPPGLTMVWRHHDLGASVHTFEHIFSHQARLIFSWGLWVIAFASWLLGFVLRFDLGQLLAGDVGTIAKGYADVLTKDWAVALTSLMYLLAIAHAGWQILRHRGQAAVAELLVAVVIALAGAYLLAHADRAGCVGLGIMADLTVGTIALTAPNGGEEPPRYDYCDGGTPTTAHDQLDTRLVFQESLQTTFVTEPFLLLQWGTVPPEDTSCRIVADALIEHGPWGDDNYPRDRMGDAGCDEMKAFNNDMTVERVTGAAVYMLSAWAFSAAVILTAGTLLAAQIAGALLVVTMPFAVVLGISPGAGREILARWGHAVLKVGVLFVGSGFFLAIMTTAVAAVQGGTDSRPLLVRMLASIIVAWSLVVLRGRLFKSMRRSSHSIAKRIAGPGSDVGPMGRSPGATVGNGVIKAAEGAMYLHGGAMAVRAGMATAGAVAKAAGSAGGAAASAAGAAGRGLTASGRHARLQLASRRATPSPAPSQAEPPRREVNPSPAPPPTDPPRRRVIPRPKAPEDLPPRPPGASDGPPQP